VSLIDLSIVCSIESFVAQVLLPAFFVFLVYFVQHVKELFLIDN
jgi:hypothetical protein